jgi:AcrR family transcriptional regulator
LLEISQLTGYGDLFIFSRNLPSLISGRRYSPLTHRAPGRQTNSMDESTPTTKTTDWPESLIEAVAAETTEFGYAGITVEGIVRRAGVTTASFYSHFADKQEAVEAAYRCLFERYFERLLWVCKTQSSWPLKVKVGVGVTLDMAAASPVEARFLVETKVGTWDFPGGMFDSQDRLARLLAAGRTETPHGGELPGVVESALVGGIVGVITSQLHGGDAKHLPALAPQLVELTLTPYLGREAAAEMAHRPRPRFEGQ